ncbi:MAG: hypothetical protein R6V85_08655 [Polyangia bacterium]
MSLSRRLTTVFVLASAIALASPLARADAEEGVTLEAWSARLAACGGGVMLDRDWSWGLEAWLRVGLPAGLEIAAPLGLALELFGNDVGSGVALAAGVVDLWVTPGRVLLLSPAAGVYARVRIAHYGSLLAAFDLTGVEEGFFRGRHPGWLRGAAALMIDVGPWLTAAAGFAYQRRAFGPEAPPGALRAGWVGDARWSIGAARVQPFGDLPTLAIHVAEWLDLIALLRVDVDRDREATDLRALGGVQVRL